MDGESGAWGWEVGRLNRAMGSGGAPQAHQVGRGAEPQRKANLMHFSLTVWHVVSTILLILLKINWPQCRINEHTGQLLVEPNTRCPTQPKFWVGQGPPGTRCRQQRLPCGWWNEPGSWSRDEVMCIKISNQWFSKLSKLEVERGWQVMMSKCSERVGEISSYLNRKAERY